LTSVKAGTPAAFYAAANMESLFLLIPLSLVLVLLIGAVLAWAVLSGQSDDLEAEGRRILDDRDLPD
jgi:cbb3-type cytochrome oxidase maturation protein